MADDTTVEHPNRRRALQLLGGVSLLGVAAACAPSGLMPPTTQSSPPSGNPACLLTPTQEEGPFYVNVALLRADVTEGQAGVPLGLTIKAVDGSTCDPLVGAGVEIWQANALGVYSDESSERTVGQTYLRGTQITDDQGQVTFSTIVPGWYPGRTMHIHLKVHTSGAQGNVVHTGQLFFPDAISDTVAAVAPYSSNTTVRTTNATDRVYTTQYGSYVVLDVTGSVSGYTADTTVSVTV
jgi:protocatechuate 3,4-dioxygenase beta subunit